jgi:hypothetical protein
MLEIDANKQDLAQLEQTLAAMLHKLNHFSNVELGQMMSDWQVNDMHRHRPFTMRSRHKASTKVRPHSLREVLGVKRYRAKLAGKRLPRRHPHRRWSTRPILRAALQSKLFTTVTEAFQRISWGG